MSSQIYYLKNKDEIILEFEVKTTQQNSALDEKKDTVEQSIEQISLYSSKLPLDIDKNDLKTTLKMWIDGRKTPDNRKFANYILSTCANKNQNGFMDYIDASFALGLNDSFWIVPKNKDCKWSDYNLYDNTFDEILELIAFNGGVHKASGFTSSPEYTTNGALQKCWHREAGKIYLYKGSTSGKTEAYNEYYASQIADALGIEHLKYDIKKFRNKIVSSCEIFTSENEGFYPMRLFLSPNERIESGNNLVTAVKKVYGLEKLQDMLLFDAIIYNKDRHTNNYGMIVNNETMEILRPAPIFDNGQCIFNILADDQLNDIDEVFDGLTSAFGYDFDTQLNLSVQKRHYDGLKKLSTFTFTRHPEFNLDEKWLVAIEKHIQKKANKALDYLIRIGIDRDITCEHTNTQQQKFRINPRTGRREIIE